MLYFNSSDPLSISVEWELQLVAKDSRDLTASATALCTSMAHDALPGSVTPGWEQSQIVLRSAPAKSITDMRSKLTIIKQAVSMRANALGVDVCGGGTHPFQRWQDSHINASHPLGKRYGNALKRGTTFGLTIKLGCRNGDEAVFLAQRMLQYLPYVIALSASSPFDNGSDSGFDSTRLTMHTTLPTTGIIDPARNWERFVRQLEHLIELGVVKSCRDLLWDICPNHEDGTIDVRVCDSPLSLMQVGDLAALIQMTAHKLSHSFFQQVPYQIFHTYRHNRFQSCRHGLQAHIIDIDERSPVSLASAGMQWLSELRKSAVTLATTMELERCLQRMELKDNAAAVLRRYQSSVADLPSLVGASVKLFADDNEAQSLAA